jgi:hypothetical protein
MSQSQSQASSVATTPKVKGPKIKLVKKKKLAVAEAKKAEEPTLELPPSTLLDDASEAETEDFEDNAPIVVEPIVEGPLVMDAVLDALNISRAKLTAEYDAAMLIYEDKLAEATLLKNAAYIIKAKINKNMRFMEQYTNTAPTKTKTKRQSNWCKSNFVEPTYQLDARRTSKLATDFDAYLVPQHQELAIIIDDHKPPVKATRNGDIRSEFLGSECVFGTLQEAVDHYKNTIKPLINKDDVKYAGICKMKRGYILKPIHKKNNINWSEGRARVDKGYEIFVTWNFDATKAFTEE